MIHISEFHDDMLPTVGEEEKDEGLVESLGHVDPEAVRLVHSLQPI